MLKIKRDCQFFMFREYQVNWFLPFWANNRPYAALGTTSRKNVADLLDFVQVRRGGGPCPIFLAQFHNCIFGQ